MGKKVEPSNLGAYKYLYSNQYCCHNQKKKKYFQLLIEQFAIQLITILDCLLKYFCFKIAKSNMCEKEKEKEKEGKKRDGVYTSTKPIKQYQYIYMNIYVESAY